jgi:hypothetical protein
MASRTESWWRRLETVELACEVQVFGRECLLGVRGEHDRDLVPADVDVGVVVGNLGGKTNAGHESHRLIEIGERERARDRLARPFPMGVFDGEDTDLVRGEV